MNLGKKVITPWVRADIYIKRYLIGSCYVNPIKDKKICIAYLFIKEKAMLFLDNPFALVQHLC